MEECVTEFENVIKLVSAAVTRIAPKVSAISVNNEKYATVMKTFSNKRDKNIGIVDVFKTAETSNIVHDKNINAKLVIKLPTRAFKPREVGVI